MEKRNSGDGWSLIPAQPPASEESVVQRAPEDHRLGIRLEKRAKGKTVTVITPLFLRAADLKALAKKLKQACGTGGTAQTDSIELQGDYCERVRDWLRERGWGLR